MRLHKGRPREASWIWIVVNRNICSADTYLVKSFVILFFIPITVGQSALSPSEVKPPICTLSTIPLTFSKTKLWKFYSLQGISPLISTCAHILFNIQTCFRIATPQKKILYTFVIILPPATTSLLSFMSTLLKGSRLLLQFICPHIAFFPTLPF